MGRIYDDLEFCAAVDVVDLHQFHQPDLGAFVGDDKTPFALIVDVFVVEIGKLDKGFVRFFKPIAHHAGVVVHLMDERQIIPFQWT
ncbi:hypothetical protein D3C80_2074150 [compost metagenome]